MTVSPVPPVFMRNQTKRFEVVRSCGLVRSRQKGHYGNALQIIQVIADDKVPCLYCTMWDTYRSGCPSTGGAVQRQIGWSDTVSTAESGK